MASSHPSLGRSRLPWWRPHSSLSSRRSLKKNHACKSLIAICTFDNIHVNCTPGYQVKIRHIIYFIFRGCIWVSKVQNMSVDCKIKCSKALIIYKLYTKKSLEALTTKLITTIFNSMLSLNDAPNYSTWFYLWRTQGGATQRGTPGYYGTPGYCVVHHLYCIWANVQYCKSGNFRWVEIFADFAAKWSGAKIKPREYYVEMCVCVCKLVVRKIKNTQYSSF